MRPFATRSLQRLSDNVAGFTLAQKVIAVIGTLALVLAGVMLFRWVATPQYAVLFSDLAPEDASAVVEQLEADGTPYELAGDGTTVRVPRDDVYSTRISLSGDGLPSGSDGGYSLLDEQDLSTSQFQEQTDFKRAMEGELATTIAAIDGVDSAIVHLALPEKEVFSDEQAPPTASVLVSTPPGDSLDPEQVQAIVHLVAASIDGMDPEKVTVTDDTGRLLSTDDGSGAMAGTREQYVTNLQEQYRTRIQGMLDRIVGPGNSTVQVSADVDFDTATIESRTYTRPGGDLALSESLDTETYDGGAADGGDAAGIVGPDGGLEDTAGTTTDGNSSYVKRSEVSDNALDTTTEQRQTSPGELERLNIAAVIERTAAANNDPEEIERMISAAVGLQTDRGDTLRVSTLPFDTSAQEAAAEELKAQEAAATKAERMSIFRNVAIGGGILLALLLAWLHSRRRAKQRREATSYVVEQLRNDPSRDGAAALAAPTAAALAAAPQAAAELEMREELIALVERQPEDVAALLRGWLVDS